MPQFDFDFDSLLAAPLRVALIGPRVASVRVERGVLDVRFGLLRVRTPLDNVEDAHVTGPYHPLRSLGVHVSLVDRGLTFGTTSRHGACIRFRRPVSGILPVPLLAHPALTVTVTDPAAFRDALLEARDAALAEEERLRAAHHALAEEPPPVRALVSVEQPSATPLTARAATRTATVPRRPRKAPTARGETRPLTPPAPPRVASSAPSKSAAPAKAVPAKAVPAKAAPAKAAPAKAAPAKAAPARKAAAKQSAVRRNAVKGTVPRKAAPEKAAPRKVAPRKAVPQETAPQETAPQQTAPAPVAPVGGEVDARRLAGNLPDTPEPETPGAATPDTRDSGPSA